MTDEDQEEQELEARKRWEMEEAEEEEHIRRREESYDQVEGIMINPPEKLGKESISEDLEQLIKANGDDIQYEFFIMGEAVPSN